MIAWPVRSVPTMAARGARIRKAARRPLFALRNLRYHVGLEPSREAHVFVLGPPRSGTTLVRQMLLAHPLLTGPDRETFFFLRWNLCDFAIDEIPPDQMAKIRARSSTSISLFDGIASWMKDANGARGFVEKSPQHALRLPFLRRYFPNSRFIFVYRDPRDGFLSARRNPFIERMTAESYAALWRDCVAARLGQGDASCIFDVRYEDFCAAPEPYLRRLMAFLGYDMAPEQLAPQRYARTSYARTPGHARLNQGITSDTVGEWRTRLTAAELRRITEIAGRELRSLGYPTRPSPGTEPAIA